MIEEDVRTIVRKMLVDFSPVFKKEIMTHVARAINDKVSLQCPACQRFDIEKRTGHEGKHYNFCRDCGVIFYPGKTYISPP